jgi:hypothetical protein
MTQSLHAVLHGTGNYRYLPAVEPYSSGVAVEKRFQIVALTFADPQPVEAGFQRLDAELRAWGLPATALVGLELLSPQPVDLSAFDAFNQTYRRLLAERGLLEGDVNPIARTNVCPVQNAPENPVVQTAFVVQPAAGKGGSDFVVAGCGELIGGLTEAHIVALGELGQDGLRKKSNAVLDAVVARIEALGATGQDPNVVNVYTAHEVDGLSQLVTTRLPGAARFGFVQRYARPPVTDVEFEMDCRHISRWELLE